MGLQDVLSFVPKIGDWMSSFTEKVIEIIAKSIGISITQLQSKLFLVLIFGIALYLLLFVVTIAKKLLKWFLVLLTLFLGVSILISMFI